MAKCGSHFLTYIIVFIDPFWEFGVQLSQSNDVIVLLHLLNELCDVEIADTETNNPAQTLGQTPEQGFALRHLDGKEDRWAPSHVQGKPLSDFAKTRPSL